MAIRRFFPTQILFAVSVVLGLACSSTPVPSDFHIGATREELLESFGAPLQKKSFVKRDDAIWGPVEDFWFQVPLDSTVEVWAYRVQGGTAELYFVDNSQRVQGTGFAPDGVLFEADH